MIVSAEIRAAGAQATLFHEYVHYLANRHSTVSYPRWYSEGLAELISSVEFRETSLVVGAPSELIRIGGPLDSEGANSFRPTPVRQMIDLNCGTLVQLAHAVLPTMIERKSGAILNVASTAAFQPGPGMAVYFATKAFVLSFSEALHEEVKKEGVVVSALCPGPTATEFGEVAGWKPAGPSAKIFVDMAADSASVVKAGLDGLENGRAIVIPGLMNKSTAQAIASCPGVGSASWLGRSSFRLPCPPAQSNRVQDEAATCSCSAAEASICSTNAG